MRFIPLLWTTFSFLTVSAQPCSYFFDDSLETINDLFVDANNEIWAATENGLSHFWNNGNSHEHLLRDSLGVVKQEILTVNGKSNAIWIGMDGGISKWDNSTWTHFNDSNVTGFPSGEVTDIEFDNSGKIWFLSAGQVYSFDGFSVINQNKTGTDLAVFNDTIYLGTLSTSESGYYFDGQSWSKLP